MGSFLKRHKQVVVPAVTALCIIAAILIATYLRTTRLLTFPVHKRYDAVLLFADGREPVSCELGFRGWRMPEGNTVTYFGDLWIDGETISHRNCALEFGERTSYAYAVNQRSVMSFGAMKDQTLTWTVAGAKLDVLVTQASYDEETGQVQFYGDDWQGVPCLLVAPAVSRAEAAELLSGMEDYVLQYEELGQDLRPYLQP